LALGYYPKRNVALQIMKRILLALMVLASVAMAGDAEMKALLVGGYWIGESGCRSRTFTFQSDGKWIVEPDGDSKWDVKGGKLMVIESEPESTHAYTILFLSEHEFLARPDDEGHGYLFFTRSGVDGS
jgi:hypothetical protein